MRAAPVDWSGPFNLEAALQTDCLQGSGPTEWNSRTHTPPRQDRPPQGRQGSSGLLRLGHQQKIIISLGLQLVLAVTKSLNGTLLWSLGMLYSITWVK